MGVPGPGTLRRPQAAVFGVSPEDGLAKLRFLAFGQQRFIAGIVFSLVVVAVWPLLVVAVDELTGPALAETGRVGGFGHGHWLFRMAHQADEIPVALVTLSVSRFVALLNFLVGKVRRWPQDVCLHIDLDEGLKNLCFSLAEIRVGWYDIVFSLDSNDSFSNYFNIFKLNVGHCKRRMINGFMDFGFINENYHNS